MHKRKKYEFDLDELILLREAMSDLVHRLSPPGDASEQRLLNYRRAAALLQQFKDDLRLL